MPNEYISREAALSEIDKQIEKNPFGAIVYAAIAIKSMLCDVPAADVAEVAHAYWIQHDAGPLKSECSVCRTTYSFRMGKEMKFCPICGARMDGGDNHAE